MRTTWRVAALTTVLVSLVALAPGASGARSWAAVDEAAIRPGAQTFTDGLQCTANFVFHNPDNPTGFVYLGQAAHYVASLDDSTVTDGCVARTRPIGTEVEVEGASHPATIVYSSWSAMQALGEADPDLCDLNDFALLRLDQRDAALVNPSVPVWGGPVRLGTATAEGEQVFTYGSSSLRLGLTPLSPKVGVSLGQSGGGRTHTVYTVTPGVPGDSGSGFLNEAGEAVGVLSTVAVTPLPASNNVTDLSRSLAYLHAHAGTGGIPASFATLRLAPGTEPFDGDPTRIATSLAG